MISLLRPRTKTWGTPFVTVFYIEKVDRNSTQKVMVKICMKIEQKTTWNILYWSNKLYNFKKLKENDWEKWTKIKIIIFSKTSIIKHKYW